MDADHPVFGAVKAYIAERNDIARPGQRILTTGDAVKDGDRAYIEFVDERRVPLVKRWNQDGYTVMLESVDSDEPLLRVKRSDIRLVRKVWGARYG